MRKLRKFFDVGLPMIGMFIVFAGALLVDNTVLRMIVVLVGVLMLEAGVWQLATPLLPSERKYFALRNEADRFIGLVRELNAAAIGVREGRGSEGQSEFARVRRAMLQSIDRMAEVAGVTEAARAKEGEAAARTPGPGSES